jgi:hypothetical protein
MSKVPGIQKLPKFTKYLRGSFGRFKTDKSFRLYYLSTSVPVDEIDDLSTASELFGLDDIKFEELIQRDIDYARVQKIANNYLSRGKDRILFFPPLLACVVLLEPDGGIKKQYTTVTHEIAEEESGTVLRATWDHDGFQLALPSADQESSERQIEWKGENRFFYDFAATLRLNPKRAKLVILDGQHRLEAMRLLRKNAEQKSIIQGLEIPICVIWAPEALKTDLNNENMMSDFRELFVRVNSEPRKVSGHFITLLKDDSYSAMTVRRLADHWKITEQPGNWSRLHLLEWNTREDERVDVRTRDFSITTLSIIFKVLHDHLFAQEGTAPDLLQLEQCVDDFAVIDSDFSWDGLVDRTQNSKIDLIIRRQIDDILISALDTLFRSPTPYNRLETALGEAFNRMQQKVAENNSSFIRLKSLLAAYIYREEEMFEDSARGAFVDFKNWVKIESDDRVYFLSVFQQGMVRFWLRMAAILKPFELKSDAAAKITIAALEKLCFVQKNRYLSVGKKYTRRTLWRNENVNFTSSWAKKAWFDILVTSLLHRGVLEEIDSLLQDQFNISPEDRSRINAQLVHTGFRSAGEYCSRLRDELIKETRQSLEEFFGDERAGQLRALKISGKEGDRKEFESTTLKKAETRFLDALSELADQLELKTDDLLRNANVS